MTPILHAVFAEVQRFTWPRLRIQPVQPDRVWLEVTGADARPWCNLHLDGTVDLHYPADPLLSVRELDPLVHHHLIWHLAHELAHVLWWKVLPPALRERVHRTVHDNDRRFVDTAETFALLTQIRVSPRLDELIGSRYYSEALEELGRVPGYERAMERARLVAERPDVVPLLIYDACRAVGEL